MSESVGTDFPNQRERVRELIEQYKAIGPAGAFGLVMLRGALKRADEAMASGDPVAIIRSYQELRDCA